MKDDSNTTPPDDFADLKSLRLGQDFTYGSAVTKLLNNIPVRKPKNQEWFRAHPDPDYHLTGIGLIRLEEDGEHYLLTPEMAVVAANMVKPFTIHTVMTRQGVVLLFPIREVGPDGRSNTYWTSATDAVTRATDAWVRMEANQANKCYDIFVTHSTPTAPIPEPEFPGRPINELFRIAFKDRLVNHIDHPLIKKLSGLDA